MSGTFTWQVDFKPKVTYAPNVRVAAFGDGYEQRIQFGINANPQKWSIACTSRLDAEAAAIDAFLQSQYNAATGQATSFFWTPPGQTTALKFVCRKWDKTPASGNGSASSPAFYWDITGVFEQVFEP